MHSNNRKNHQKGFTLIELLVTVAIIAILAILGATAYASYTQKAQVTEAFKLVPGMQQKFVAYLSENGGSAPTSLVEMYDGDNAAVPAAFSGAYVGAIDLIDGRLVVTYGPNSNMNGQTLHFTPFSSGKGMIQWTCGYAPDATPGGFAAQAIPNVPATSASVATTIPAEYLPARCQA